MAVTSAALALPDGLVAYRSTPEFTLETIPSALLRDHTTKAGTWGLIHVTEGTLRYTVTDPRRQTGEWVLASGDPPGVVEPTILHHVAPIGPVRFHVEFWRAADAS